MTWHAAAVSAAHYAGRHSIMQELKTKSLILNRNTFHIPLHIKDILITGNKTYLPGFPDINEKINKLTKE